MRRKIISLLWDKYIISIPSFNKIEFIDNVILDHLAIIDLGYGHSNRLELVDIFSSLGFILCSSDYLSDKKNDFLWMAENDCHNLNCNEVTPQVVLADFRIDCFSEPVREIIKRYASYQQPFDKDKFMRLMSDGDVDQTAQFLLSQLYTRAWPLPTLQEYNTVLKESELVAWVLLFGRQVNHFGISVDLSSNSTDLNQFNSQLLLQTGIELNDSEGMIKGGELVGLAQSSTLGAPIFVKLEGGTVATRDSFMEFVWRYPNTSEPKLWRDYYRGFTADNANKIIESLYV